MFQMIRRSNAGQHQDLGRADCSGAEDDLVVGVRDFVLAIVLVLNAVRFGPGIIPERCTIGVIPDI